MNKFVQQLVWESFDKSCHKIAPFFTFLPSGKSSINYKPLTIFHTLCLPTNNTFADLSRYIPSVAALGGVSQGKQNEVIVVGLSSNHPCQPRLLQRIPFCHIFRCQPAALYIASGHLNITESGSKLCSQVPRPTCFQKWDGEPGYKLWSC